MVTGKRTVGPVLEEVRTLWAEKGVSAFGQNEQHLQRHDLENNIRGFGNGQLFCFSGRWGAVGLAVVVHWRCTGGFPWCAGNVCLSSSPPVSHSLQG